MELCLGTVQLGMDYGILGKHKPDLAEAIAILDYAVQNGIRAIDTANAYGVAEEVIGAFLDKKTIRREELFLVSKVKPNLLDGVPEEQYYAAIKENLENTLQRLHTDYLDSYLLHSSRYIFNDAIIAALGRLKKEGYAGKTGVSVYEPEEAQRCIEHSDVDFMQLPFSIFDQRMLAAGIFRSAALAGTTQIHSRSAFIQGLVLMGEDEAPPFLAKAKPVIRKMDEVCRNYRVSRLMLAMSFVERQRAVSHLVFGVDSIGQLREDIDVFRNPLPDELVDEIGKEFIGIDTDIVMPSLWKK